MCRLSKKNDQKPKSGVVFGRTQLRRRPDHPSFLAQGLETRCVLRRHAMAHHRHRAHLPSLHATAHGMLPGRVRIGEEHSEPSRRHLPCAHGARGRHARARHSTHHSCDLQAGSFPLRFHGCRTSECSTIRSDASFLSCSCSSVRAHKQTNKLKRLDLSPPSAGRPPY